MSEAAQKIEDLIAWQKARALVGKIYKLTDAGKFGRDFALKGQIRRASVSIMSNIAEGFERNRSGEVHQFLSVAKGSCAELRSQLYVGLDAGYMDHETFEDVRRDAEEVGRILGGLRAAVQRKRDA